MWRTDLEHCHTGKPNGHLVDSGTGKILLPKPIPAGKIQAQNQSSCPVDDMDHTDTSIHTSYGPHITLLTYTKLMQLKPLRGRGVAVYANG